MTAHPGRQLHGAADEAAHRHSAPAGSTAGRDTVNQGALEAVAPKSVVDTVANLCKRRGFVYPCGEIYGGTRSAWDYGPLGVELKENIQQHPLKYQ